MKDPLHNKILKIVNSANQPLHTMEIARKLGVDSHYKISNMLLRMASDGKIRHRRLDVAKGIDIWWRNGAFQR